MSTSFKKVLVFVASLILSHFTAYGLVWLYSNYVIGPGNSFGGEIIFYFPIGLVCIFFYYFLLKKLFGLNNISGVIN